MKRLFLSAAVVAVFFLGGCGARDELVGSCVEAWKLIAPEYLEYVANDESLGAESKVIRQQHVEELTKALEELAK